MNNPFENRSPSLSGPAVDIMPVTPDDGIDLAEVAVGLYVEGAGDVVIITVRDQQRTVAVSDFTILPVGTKRVMATGTTATGIHAMVVS